MERNETAFGNPEPMTRKTFLGVTAAAAFAGASWAEETGTPTDGLADFQKELDAITPGIYRDFDLPGVELPDAARDKAYAEFPGLKRYDAAFEKAVAEAKDTVVTDKPAVWFIYNMGVLVKTPQSFFSIDLHHRLAERLAPVLDFALITHNHGDHFTQRFYQAMNGKEQKTVVSNFADNYGAYFAKKHPGGYTHGPKAFRFRDVQIQTSLSDHNGYLVDFTMPFEVTVGDYTIFHTGDSANIAKLTPQKTPDLWIVHPYCGLKAADGVKKFAPKLTVIAHLQELGHARNRWRWSFADGKRAVAAVEEAGGKAVMPLWGDRIV
ncbi:MAG: MBL fold metallo-hydrolase [Kiritimatiellae bacterium]|nr:MBL fold metallo-hydrolase [Kiritimatiellia bacterium]